MNLNKKTIITALLAIVTLAGQAKEIVRELLPSYWRDDQTGDWVIAFTDECAIYDCKFWDYKQRDINPKTGEAKMVLTNGNDELKVTVGKDKKGKRTMQIGNQKVTYSMITSRFLPDYPTKDTRTEFVNSGYKMDTVMVVGWLKDRPDELKSLKTFDFKYKYFIADDDEDGGEKFINVDLDEQGRFMVKIPVINSQPISDERLNIIESVVEPGKTYFLLYDYKKGRRYFMGDDVRLQNELLKNPFYTDALTLYTGMESVGKNTPETLDRYIVSVDSLLKVQYADIDALCEAHTLSTRYNLFQKGCVRNQQAHAFGQARLTMPNMKLTDNARKYAHDTFWTQLEEPYTLYPSQSDFVRDFLDDEAKKRKFLFSPNYVDYVNEIASNDEELALLNRWKEWKLEATAKIKAAPTVEEKQKLANELNTQNADMLKQVDKIINSSRTDKLMDGKTIIAWLNEGRQMLDSLQSSPAIKDLYLSRMVYEIVDNRHSSLSPTVLETLKSMTGTLPYIETIEKESNHYLAIENREFDKKVLKSSDYLANISEGEALLKKIIEPCKGKFVLLDIWGTWCGPCKEALSHSTEEYARLKDYDIEFLYLANRSPQESWENVIKEYNVSGPNVAHYNLPAEQQAAIEQFLGVHGWPHYRLIDRDGRVLDVNADPNELEGLAGLLEEMK